MLSIEELHEISNKLTKKRKNDLRESATVKSKYIVCGIHFNHDSRPQDTYNFWVSEFLVSTGLKVGDKVRVKTKYGVKALYVLYIKEWQEGDFVPEQIATRYYYGNKFDSIQLSDYALQLKEKYSDVCPDFSQNLEDLKALAELSVLEKKPQKKQPPKVEKPKAEPPKVEAVKPEPPKKKKISISINRALIK